MDGGKPACLWVFAKGKSKVLVPGGQQLIRFLYPGYLSGYVRYTTNHGQEERPLGSLAPSRSSACRLPAFPPLSPPSPPAPAAAPRHASIPVGYHQSFPRTKMKKKEREREGELATVGHVHACGLSSFPSPIALRGNCRGKEMS